jgi:hypothetical protein
MDYGLKKRNLLPIYGSFGVVCFERRPTAGYSETDAGAPQCTDGVTSSLGEDLLLGDEGTVHVRRQERDFGPLYHRQLWHRSVERPPSARIAYQQAVRRGWAGSTRRIIWKIPR